MKSASAVVVGEPPVTRFDLPFYCRELEWRSLAPHVLDTTARNALRDWLAELGLQPSSVHAAIHRAVRQATEAAHVAAAVRLLTSDPRAAYLRRLVRWWAGCGGTSVAPIRVWPGPGAPMRKLLRGEGEERRRWWAIVGERWVRVNWKWYAIPVRSPDDMATRLLRAEVRAVTEGLVTTDGLPRAGQPWDWDMER